MGKKEGSYKPSAFRAEADNWQERQAAILANLTSKRHAQNDPLEDGEDDVEGDSESDEDEDDYGEELTPAMDAAILRTLRMIRRGEGVYGDEKVLEEALKVAETEATQRKITVKHPQGRGEKKYTLQDFQRQALLSQPQGGPSRPYHPHGEEEHYEVPDTIIPLTHVEEERLLRKEVTQAFHTSGAADMEEEDDDDFLVKKEKTDQEADVESKKYREFLLSQAGGEDAVRELLGMKEGGMEGQDHRYDEAEEDGEEVDEEDVEVDIKQEGERTEVKREKSKKKAKKVRTKKDDDEFLMNYILNRGWIDQDDSSVPAGEKKAKASSSKLQAEEEDEEEQEAPTAGPWGTLEDDEDFDDLADEFENTYNFRFEEPGASNIITHARTLPNTVRRADDSRKLARQAKAERKAEKAAQYAEKTKREKGKKRREIEKRMEALSQELGVEGFKRLEQELDGDWDEEGFDKIVQRIVGADVEAGDDEDDEKPTWGDDIDTAYAEEDGGEEDFGAGFDEGFAEGAAEEGADLPEEMYEEDDGPINMDADFIAIPDDSKRKSRKDKKKKKDKGKQRAAEEDVDMDEVAGLSVEDQKAKIKSAMEDYSKLDYEDVIDDLPTRFKYTKAEPQTYGLTPAEILLATDAELNEFLAVKHYAPYRHGSGVGAAGRGMRDRLKALRAKLAARRWGEEEVPEDTKQPKRKQDAGWKAKNKQSANGDANKGDGPKKRKGKKERQRQAAAGGAGEGEAVVGGKRKERDEEGGQDSSKKQRV